MEKQVIISISREFGSGGLDIAKLLGERFGLHVYDKRMLDEIAQEKNMDVEVLHKYDEKPRNRLLTRSVRGHTNSMEENIIRMQFDYIRRKADSGESFIIVGRCAETVLQGNPSLISIFVTGDKEYKQKRVMDQFSLTKEEATAKIERIERLRRQYHNHYSDHKWGDSRFYDMCINGSDLGVEGTADVLEKYIGSRIEKM